MSECSDFLDVAKESLLRTEKIYTGLVEKYNTELMILNAESIECSESAEKGIEKERNESQSEKFEREEEVAQEEMD